VHDLFVLTGLLTPGLQQSLKALSSAIQKGQLGYAALIAVKKNRHAHIRISQHEENRNESRSLRGACGHWESAESVFTLARNR